MAEISEKKLAHSYKYRRPKKNIIFKKSRHFVKNKTISVNFLNKKSKTLYVTRFFMKMLRLAFIYKKHGTLSYVTFIYKKPDNSQKVRQFALIFYIHKSGHFALRDFMDF